MTYHYRSKGLVLANFTVLKFKSVTFDTVVVLYVTVHEL